MKSARLISCCLLLTLCHAFANAQIVGWSCLRNINGDTMKLDGAGTMVQGADGALYFAGKLHDSLYGGIIRWNDTTWGMVDSAGGTALGHAVSSPLCTDAQGNIYATVNTGPGTNWGVAKWNDTNWTLLRGTGNDTLAAFYIMDKLCTDASGNVYAASRTQAPSSTGFVAMWDGAKWINLPADPLVNNNIHAMCADGLGNLYVAGGYTGVSVYHIAKWDGLAWSMVGTGANALNANGRIAALYCDGNNNIYAGGSFTNTGGNNYVAKWDGNTWTELGGATLQVYGDIVAITSNGQGKIYAAGRFTKAMNIPYVAVYDGTSWSELGAAPFPLNVQSNGWLSYVCTDKKGNVYAGGNIFQVNGNGMTYIARYGIAPYLSVGKMSTAADDIQVYPNPTAGQLHVSFAQPGTQHYYLYDMRGILVRSGTMAGKKADLDISDISAGIYLLQVGESNSFSVRVHKQ